MSVKGGKYDVIDVMMGRRDKVSELRDGRDTGSKEWEEVQK